MIVPDKHTNIRYSVIYISGVMMNEIKINGIIKYSDLQDVILMKIGKQAKEVFEFAISFLYLIGKVEYNEKLDSIIMLDK